MNFEKKLHKIACNFCKYNGTPCSDSENIKCLELEKEIQTLFHKIIDECTEDVVLIDGEHVKLVALNKIKSMIGGDAK